MDTCCLCTWPQGPGLFSVRPKNSSNSPSSEGILLLDDKINSEIEGHRHRLKVQQKKLKEAQEKEKNEKIERMKQWPAENMTIAVLKQLLQDKGIAFRPEAKKLELVEIFNTQAGYVTAYDGCFPKPKQFYFADKHPQKLKNR